MEKQFNYIEIFCTPNGNVMFLVFRPNFTV